MAGSQIAIPANGAADWSDFVTIVERNLRGWMALSLTNMSGTSEPAISAGSALDVGGAFYQFGSEEAITGWSGIGDDTDVWIKVVPDGSSITVEFTTDVPTWSDAKQGWYDTNDRYVGWLRRDSGSAYRYKHYLPRESRVKISFEEILEIGDWDMVDGTGTDFVDIAHELALANIRDTWVMIRNDAGGTDSLTPIGGDEITKAGALQDGRGSVNVDATNVSIRRLVGGLFDHVDWNSTSYNRGWLGVWHQIL